MNLDGMKINWTTWSKEDPRNLKKLVNNLQIILVSCKSSNENLPVIVNWNGVAEARLFGHVQDLFQYAFGAVYTGALSIQTGKWDWAHFGSLDQVSTRWTRFVFLLDWLMSFNWKKPGKKLAWPWFTHFQGSDLDVFAIAGCSDRKDSWHLKPDEWESEGGKGVKGLTGIPKMRYYRMEMESLASSNFVEKISMAFGFVSQNSSQERDHVKRDLERCTKPKLRVSWISTLDFAFYQSPIELKACMALHFCFKQRVRGASEDVNFRNLSSWVYHISWFFWGACWIP